MSRILMIDDEINFLKTYSKILKTKDYEVKVATDPEKALNMASKNYYDIVLSDMVMPIMSGIDVLKELKKINPNYNVIIFTGEGSIESAVEAMKLGAFSYITKPIDIEGLFIEIEKCINQQKIKDQNEYYRKEINKTKNDLIGDSKFIRELKKEVKVIAPTDSSILVTGESGTGKELVADLIHNSSKRRNKPIIKINCAELSKGVLESELFGHEKGAFTGATYSKKGRFEIANEGTLFLDEIGDIPMEIQTKLLRVIQEKQFYRVGGKNLIKSDFRLICATNKDLKESIACGEFREDLYYRINVLPIEIIPLRERKKDIIELVNYYIEKNCQKLKKDIPKISEKARIKLIDYYWTGNIRELINVVERIIVYNQDNTIGIEDLPTEIIINKNNEKTKNKLTEAKEEFEMFFIMDAIKRNKGNIAKTSRDIGIARNNLYDKLKKYNIEW